MTQPTAEQTVEQYQAAQAEEYGMFVALQPITHNGALAYNAGASVPVSNVKLYGYDKDNLVARRGTKAANAVLGITDEPKG